MKERKEARTLMRTEYVFRTLQSVCTEGIQEVSLVRDKEIDWEWLSIHPEPHS